MKKIYILIISSIPFVCGCDNTDKQAEKRRDSLLTVQAEKIDQLQRELENSQEKVKELAKPIEVKKIEETSFFTIGSTENEVLTIQGQPTSIQNLPNGKLLGYGMSSVTFFNGVVESFMNYGNLKIKVVASSSGKTNSQKTNDITKYVYFIFLTDEMRVEMDPATGKAKNIGSDYSKIYSIAGYDYKKEESLEFCLEGAYKQWTGKKVTMLPRSFDDRRSAFSSWNNETGTLFQDACGELMQIGILAQ
jgi:hypothetical protein